MNKTTVIDKGTVFKGQLKTEGNLKVLGKMMGEIEVKGLAFIEKGLFSGKLKAESVISDGEIEGEIVCRRFIEISGGKVRAKLKAPAIIISEFAEYPPLKEIIKD